VSLVTGTRAATLYDVTKALEEYWCNYGVNSDYVKPLAHAGLTVSGVGEDGEIRIVELTDHPFYVATLFLPQKRSAPGQPHPVLAGFAVAVGGGDRRSV
jgi:CTP synthase (UTP-ammonia lyase)